jgi:cell division protein ZapB
MQNELKNLEEKLAKLIEFNARTRAENLRLRLDLANAQSQLRKSEDKIDSASQRLETILATLPGNSL